MNRSSPASVIRALPEKTFVHVDKLPGTRDAARKAVSRAAAEGELLAVRRGLYYRGRRTRYGMTTPQAEEIVREVLGTRGVGPAGYSAARIWGVTTQVPAKWHVATLRVVDGIEGVEQHSRRNIARADLSAKEIALLELLRAPEVYVESSWDSLVSKVSRALNSKEIRESSLREAVASERNPTVRANFDRLFSDSSVAVA